MWKRFLDWLCPVEQTEEDGCKKAQRIGSKYGYVITCPEDDVEIEVEVKSADCEKLETIANKYGFNLICR